VHNGETELRIQLPSSHPLTAAVHPPERVTGPPELHHSKGRYPGCHRMVLILLILPSLSGYWLTPKISGEQLLERYGRHFCSRPLHLDVSCTRYQAWPSRLPPKPSSINYDKATALG
jgi:hypothetical protein